MAGAQRRAMREVTARVSFVNRVSHELGAPLTNIKLSLDLARDALPPDTAQTSVRRLDIAMEEASRLGRLVDNVLSFARSERGERKLQSVSFDPALLTGHVLDQFRPALERRGIAVETSLAAGLSVTSAPDEFSQIAANLVSNVEKYAADGGWMQVSLEARNEAMVLTVSDHGPGIPAGDVERMFLPFERMASSLTEGVSGTGLGLAIARDLAGRMGGRITYRDGTRGSIFEVSIPLQPLPMAAPLAAAHPSAVMLPAA